MQSLTIVDVASFLARFHTRHPGVDIHLRPALGGSASLAGLLLAPQGAGMAVAMWLSGRATERLGGGTTALLGGIISVISTIPFVVIGDHTSYVFLSAVMVIRGFGIGMSAMPAMTAAYRVLGPHQINDATPQLSVLQRVGGSIGTAILTVVLQHQLTRAGTSTAAQASGFGTTFWWVLGVTAVATAPTLLLRHMERQAHGPETAVESAADAMMDAL